MWEEDFERAAYLHYMYLIEKQMEEEEWWQFEMEQERQKRLPARIEVLTPIPNLVKHETESDSIPF